MPDSLIFQLLPWSLVILLLVLAAVLAVQLFRTRERVIRAEAELNAVRETSVQTDALLAQARETLRESFAEVGARALKASNEQFLTLAQTHFQAQQQQAVHELDSRKQAISSLLQPVGDALRQVQNKLGDMEKDRQFTYASLREQIKLITESNTTLRKETSRLSQALHNNNMRGKWGELQLRRVVEMAGMVEYCDFTVQTSRNDDQSSIRPDLVVNLPGNRHIIVDAKAPMNAYLEAMATEDPDQRSSLLVRHARQVRDHLTRLGSKSYFSQFENTPEFVVMFLPGESFFQAAMEADPTLIETGVDNRVILATPTTLIALLRAVAYGWRQEQLAENARAISKAGADLYDSCITLTEHFCSVGQSLNRTVAQFNKAVASYESRLLPRARKLRELGIPAKKDIPEAIPAPESLARELAPVPDESRPVFTPLSAPLK